MAAKRIKMSDRIRQLIDDSGMSRYRIAKESGLDQAALSRFMQGTGITTESLDKLADSLDLEIRRRKGR